MMFPPSLDHTIRARAFLAANGELGIHPKDVASFLAACRVDCAEVLGWELWVIDHTWGDHININGPVSAPGAWCGGIPVKGNTLPVVFSFGGDVDEAERQFASVDLQAEVLPDWLPHVRVNFTLAD